MENFLAENQWLIWLTIAWAIPWKGVALWKSAQKRQYVWFVVFLLVNTLAILEILYIFIFSKKDDELNKNGNNGYKNGNSVLPPRRIV